MSVSTALRRIRSWLSPESPAQRAPTAIRKAPAIHGGREIAVLHAIRVLHGTAHRTSIQEELERARIEMSFAAINSCLEWLEDNRFVASRMTDPTIDRNGRRKEIFELTDKGKEALRG
jgi:PadR family transcriptional regulator, regulatory protein PadR